jgi:hypothetical protein
MNSATHGSAGDRSDDQTPGTDIQPDDAGTPASGNSGRGTAADAAMKQTAKTEHESGSGRPGDGADPPSHESVQGGRS